MGTLLRNAIVSLLLLTVVTGIAYPLAVTGIAQILFPSASNGSIVVENGRPLGSALIGQPFSDPKYFWSRPSATTPFADNPGASTGSNLGPTNPALSDAVKQRIETLRAADPGNATVVPVDLVTASGSGLDPEISPAAAHYQVARVARVRGLSVDAVQTKVARATRGRQLGVLGEPRVNVLELNLMLDKAD